MLGHKSISLVLMQQLTSDNLVIPSKLSSEIYSSGVMATLQL
jgi:hypothetical protein